MDSTFGLVLYGFIAGILVHRQYIKECKINETLECEICNPSIIIPGKSGSTLNLKTNTVTRADGSQYKLFISENI